MRTFFQVLTLFVGIAIYGLAMAFQGKTLVSPPAVWFTGAALAAIISITAWRIWRRVTGTDRRWINYIVSTVMLTGLLVMTFYLVNAKAGAGEGERRECKAAVERVYYKVRHRTRRVGRRYYATGEEYHTYHIDIRLPYGSEGMVKSLEIPFDEYNRYARSYRRRPDSVSCTIRRGALGFDVFERDRAAIRK